MTFRQFSAFILSESAIKNIDSDKCEFVFVFLHLHLYKTLFKQPDNHVAVVEALATKRRGLTRNEIIKATKLHDNGNLKQVLENLTNSEFIRPYKFFGKEKKDTIYQLTDFYTMFYFNYIKDNYGRDEHCVQSEVVLDDLFV